MSTTAVHALDMVTHDEIRLAAEIVRADSRFEAASVFVHVRLYEPAKDADAGSVDREIEALLVPPDARLEAIEVIVSVSPREIRSWTVQEGARPALLFGESLQAMLGVQAHPDWQAALRRRGIEDSTQVQIDPWPAGSFGVAHEEGRRISRCIAYWRESPSDNGYARPIEGLIAFFDNGAGKVLEVVDLGVVPMPPEKGSYFPADVGPMRDDLERLEIVQPDGPSFHVDGNLVQWQRWSFRVGFDPYEGLVLHTVGYQDGDRVRPVLHRASVCEMVVPYGDPGAMHGWKNAFDAGEWGLGRMANSLKLGCDCLGVIQYFDAVLATEQGEPYTVEHAICVHEEDYGILWKHVDQRGGTDEVRRSRRLVVSFVATVGNYEYGFYWYLYLDGNIQLEVKLTGIVSTMAITPGEQPAFANVIAPGLAAAHHQHLFSAASRRRRRWRRQQRVRGRGGTRSGGPRESVGQRVRAEVDASRLRAPRATRDERGDEPRVEDRQSHDLERARTTRRLQARTHDVHAHAARVGRLERRPPRRLRPSQPLGHAVPARRTPRRGGIPQSARRR